MAAMLRLCSWRLSTRGGWLLFALLSAFTLATAAATDCDGRRIYVHKLPRSFNKYLLYNQAKDIDPGARDPDAGNMIRHIKRMTVNSGFGKAIPGLKHLPALKSLWYQTDMNALEIIFPARMATYECRVDRHEDADLIYVPYYGGHDAIRNMFKSQAERDKLAVKLVAWLKAHPAWRRNNGSDHFLVLGRVIWDFGRKPTELWGSSLMWMDGIKNNVWTVVTETHYIFEKAISCPWPVAFHPSSQQHLLQWQKLVREHERPWLFSFAGGRRPNTTEEGVLRNKLFWQCENSPLCKSIDCSGHVGGCEDINDFFDLYMSSNFCLHPVGDSCTRRSTLDGMLAGCIPVVFKTCSMEDQYQWHFDRSQGRMEIFIPHDNVRGAEDKCDHNMPGKDCQVLVEDVLKAIPKEEIAAMRRRVIEHIPSIVFGGTPKGRRLAPPDFKDAIDRIIDGLSAANANKRFVQ